MNMAIGALRRGAIPLDMVRVPCVWRMSMDNELCLLPITLDDATIAAQFMGTRQLVLDVRCLSRQDFEEARLIRICFEMELRTRRDRNMFGRWI